MPELFAPAAVSRRWRITVAILGLLALLTRHYPLQNAVHVGMFAGSLLQHGDWDHSKAQHHG